MPDSGQGHLCSVEVRLAKGRVAQKLLSSPDDRDAPTTSPVRSIKNIREYSRQSFVAKRHPWGRKPPGGSALLSSPRERPARFGELCRNPTWAARGLRFRCVRDIGDFGDAHIDAALLVDPPGMPRTSGVSFY